MRRNTGERLPVKKILREFEGSEAQPEHRGDAFKINTPFDEALRRAAKPKHMRGPAGPKS